MIRFLLRLYIRLLPIFPFMLPSLFARKKGTSCDARTLSFYSLSFFTDSLVFFRWRQVAVRVGIDNEVVIETGVANVVAVFIQVR